MALRRVPPTVATDVCADSQRWVSPSRAPQASEPPDHTGPAHSAACASEKTRQPSAPLPLTRDRSRPKQLSCAAHIYGSGVSQNAPRPESRGTVPAGPACNKKAHEPASAHRRLQPPAGPSPAPPPPALPPALPPQMTTKTSSRPRPPQPCAAQPPMFSPGFALSLPAP